MLNASAGHHLDTAGYNYHPKFKDAQRSYEMRSIPLMTKLMYTVFFAVAACSPAISQTDLPSPEITTVIPATFAPTHTSFPTNTPALLQTSFESTVYRDEPSGFELDYPAAWTAETPQIGGDRGYFTLLTSWQHAPGELPEGIPPGGTTMSIDVLQWDPKNALDEYVDTRKQGWAASGFEILSEKQLMLEEDWPAARFLIRTPEETTFFFATTIGEKYLVLSGSGDLETLEEISRTIRYIETNK